MLLDYRGETMAQSNAKISISPQIPNQSTKYERSAGKLREAAVSGLREDRTMTRSIPHTTRVYVSQSEQRCPWGPWIIALRYLYPRTGSCSQA